MCWREKLNSTLFAFDRTTGTVTEIAWKSEGELKEGQDWIHKGQVVTICAWKEIFIGHRDKNEIKHHTTNILGNK